MAYANIDRAVRVLSRRAEVKASQFNKQQRSIVGELEVRYKKLALAMLAVVTLGMLPGLAIGLNLDYKSIYSSTNACYQLYHRATLQPLLPTPSTPTLPLLECASQQKVNPGGWQSLLRLAST